MGDPVVRLSDEDLTRLADLVADRLAERLRPRTEPVLLTARQVAERFGVSAEWVRDHAQELHVVRLGGGRRPRLRFDAAKVTEAMTAFSGSENSQDGDLPASDRNREGSSGPLSDSEVAALPRRELKPRRTTKSDPRGVGAPGGLAQPEVAG